LQKSNRKTKDAKEEALFNMRKTNSSAQEATKKMYEMLHETEHRLLAIQAGGSYLQHLAACKVLWYFFSLSELSHHLIKVRQLFYSCVGHTTLYVL